MNSMINTIHGKCRIRSFAKYSEMLYGVNHYGPVDRCIGVSIGYTWKVGIYLVQYRETLTYLTYFPEGIIPTRYRDIYTVGHLSLLTL